MAFCTACGQPRNTAGRFCTACGAPFAGPAGPGGPAGDPEDEVDEAFGGLFAPRRDDPGNRNDTARLPPVTPAGGGAGGGWPGPGWEGGPEPAREAGPGSGWEGGPAADWQGGPGHDWTARPPAASGTRSKVISVVIGAAVVVAAGGGVLGFVMHGHHAQPGSNPAQRPASASAPRGSSAAGRPVPGNSTVAVAPGVARNPAAAPIVRLLTRYFTAINSHDFTGYQALLDARMRRSVTAARFASGYRSTRDSGATLTGISTAADGRTTAVVTFTSHQDPADSPDRSSCTNWSITLFLDRSGGGYLIGPAEPGYHASHQPC